MSDAREARYFVSGLTENSHRPVPDAEFQIEILNDIGQGETIVYFSYRSNEPLAIIPATKARSAALDHTIPEAIVEATRHRSNWPGYYVDESGQVTLPSFMNQTKDMLDAEREKVRSRNR
jgi:hypothetical protein